MSTMRPFSSAIGMKSFGGTSPRVGCCQRTSASSDTTRFSASETIGWYCDDELVVLQRAAQIGLELEPGDGRGVHLGFVDAVAALALALGPVHRGVGVAQELVGVVAVRARVGDARRWRG